MRGALFYSPCISETLIRQLNQLHPQVDGTKISSYNTGKTETLESQSKTNGLT